MTEQITPLPDTTPPGVDPPPSELTDPPVPSEEEGEKYDGGPIPEVAPEVETVPDPEG